MSRRRELANAIRALSMDAVQSQIRSLCLQGMADIAEVLWRDYLNHNPANPECWIVTALCCPMAMVPC